MQAWLLGSLLAWVFGSLLAEIKLWRFIRHYDTIFQPEKEESGKKIKRLRKWKEKNFLPGWVLS